MVYSKQSVCVGLGYLSIWHAVTSTDFHHTMIYEQRPRKRSTHLKFNREKYMQLIKIVEFQLKFMHLNGRQTSYFLTTVHIPCKKRVEEKKRSFTVSDKVNLQISQGIDSGIFVGKQ